MQEDIDKQASQEAERLRAEEAAVLSFLRARIRRPEGKRDGFQAAEEAAARGSLVEQLKASCREISEQASAQA